MYACVCMCICELNWVCNKPGQETSKAPGFRSHQLSASEKRWSAAVSSRRASSFALVHIRARPASVKVQNPETEKLDTPNETWKGKQRNKDKPSKRHKSHTTDQVVHFMAEPTIALALVTVAVEPVIANMICAEIMFSFEFNARYDKLTRQQHTLQRLEAKVAWVMLHRVFSAVNTDPGSIHIENAIRRSVTSMLRC